MKNCQNLGPDPLLPDIKQALINIANTSTPTPVKMFVNLKNGDIYLGISRSLSNSQKLIHKVTIDTKQHNIIEYAQMLKEACYKYSSVNRKCYTTVCSFYGRKVMEKIEPLYYVDNKYYKCAAPMKIYDINVLNYNLKGIRK